MRSALLLLIAVSMISIPVSSSASAKSTSGLPDSTPIDSALGDFFDVRLDFSGPPLLNEAAELVVTVSPAQDVSNVVIHIILPEGIELIEGDLRWEGNLFAHQQLQRKVVVKVVNVGSYEIQASVEGLTADGQMVRQSKQLYVATSETTASVSEIPIGIPEKPIMSPLPEIEVGDQAGEIELAADSKAGLVTIGDDSPSAPKEVEEQGFQLDKGVLGGEAELVADSKAGLATISDESPSAPKEVEEQGFQLEKGVLGGEAELSADQEEGLMTIGDDSPNAPEVLKEQKVQLKEGALGGEAELTADQEAGLLTIGDDSPNAPKVIKGKDLRDVVLGLSLPDLIVDDIWSTTTPLDVGQWENVTFRIKNQGGADATSRFYTRMWIGGTEIQTWYT
ncbi:MAG: hypothetical protein FJY85_17635, partial [Deltaproteobacteria bacterium]|nr:hypothetical protein [Deltaproteobacteria bacterium]